MKRSKREEAKKSAQNKKLTKASAKQQKALRESAKDKIFSSFSERKKEPKIYKHSFLEVVDKKASKLLLSPEYRDHIESMINLVQYRNVSDWSPKGKGREALFISLCEHLFAQYKMPKFIWSAFWETDSKKLIPIILRVARGESFIKMCQSGDFPLPLTKKQCHSLMNTKSDLSFMSALRKIQIDSHEINTRLLKAWMSRDVGRRLHSKETEVFWDSVIAWFCKNPMLDLNQLGPLVDYIDYRYRQDKSFSMKGRSALAMIRGMNEWHGELTKRRQFEEHNYTPSGFKKGFWETKDPKCIWRIEEILTSKDLHDEGRKHSHCVASYGHSIKSGVTSIWSLTCDNEKLITIEVRNHSRQIVQARGKFNRVSKSEEFKYIVKWANENNLSVNLGL